MYLKKQNKKTWMDASFLYLLSVIDYTEVTAITERNAVLRRHNTITGKPSAVNTERETVKTSAVRTNICLTPHKKTHNSVSVCQASVELALIAFVLLFLCYSVFLPSSSLFLSCSSSCQFLQLLFGLMLTVRRHGLMLTSVSLRLTRLLKLHLCLDCLSKATSTQ